jgi:hypothetical protein
LPSALVVNATCAVHVHAAALCTTCAIGHDQQLPCAQRSWHLLCTNLLADPWHCIGIAVRATVCMIPLGACICVPPGVVHCGTSGKRAGSATPALQMRAQAINATCRPVKLSWLMMDLRFSISALHGVSSVCAVEVTVTVVEATHVRHVSSEPAQSTPTGSKSARPAANTRLTGAASPGGAMAADLDEQRAPRLELAMDAAQATQADVAQL